MPTIQFRTDNQTKVASTALFNRLGISMSEAINLFLRQSIMRGGIPFALQVPKEYTGMHAVWESPAFIDALRRYKAVNDNADFNIAEAEPFLLSFAGLHFSAEPRMTLYKDAIKVRVSSKGKEFAIDYNFEEPETVFILSRQDGKLLAKDCELDEIEKTLELF